ncbi:MAG: YlxR family protein [Deltaproteobacteria bacterium]|nr:YlxR family protein [Deltaproteobacteria bacterium]
MGCRVVRSKAELLRFVVDGGGGVRFDEAQRRRGRGAYACASVTCLEQAGARGGFARAFRRRVPARSGADLQREVQTARAAAERKASGVG